MISSDIDPPTYKPQFSSYTILQYTQHIIRSNSTVQQDVPHEWIGYANPGFDIQWFYFMKVSKYMLLINSVAMLREDILSFILQQSVTAWHRVSEKSWRLLNRSAYQIKKRKRFGWKRYIRTHETPVVEDRYFSEISSFRDGNFSLNLEFFICKKKKKKKKKKKFNKRFIKKKQKKN